MNIANRISTRFAATAAAVAGVALAVTGIIQITDAQSSQSTVVGIEHVTLAALTVTLLALVPVTLLLGRTAGRLRPAFVAATGQVVLALLCVVSNVRGEDPSFFAAVAVPTNLMWFGGFIALAVALKRSGRFPARLAVLLPLTWIAALPLSAVGGGLLAGAYWITLAWMLAQGELPARARPAAA